MKTIDRLYPSAFLACDQISSDGNMITFHSVFSGLYPQYLPLSTDFYLVAMGYGPPGEYPLVIDVVPPWGVASRLLEGQMGIEPGQRAALWAARTRFVFEAEGWYEIKLTIEHRHFTSLFLAIAIRDANG